MIQTVTGGVYIKSEDECRSILTTEVEIKNEEDDYEQPLPVQFGEVQPPIAINLRCPLCRFKTISATNLNEHLQTHASRGLRKIICKECASGDGRLCSVHRNENLRSLISDSSITVGNYQTHTKPLISVHKLGTTQSSELTSVTAIESNLHNTTANTFPQLSLGKGPDQSEPILQSNSKSNQIINVCTINKPKLPSKFSSQRDSHVNISSVKVPFQSLSTLQLNSENQIKKVKNTLHATANTFPELSLGKSPDQSESTLQSNSKSNQIKNVKCTTNKPKSSSKSNSQKDSHVNVSSVKVPFQSLSTLQLNSEKQIKKVESIKKKSKTCSKSNPRVNSIVDLRFKCDECSFIGTSYFKLKKHLGIHVKSYTCSNCQYQTENIYDLEQHLRLHAIEDSFTCRICFFETPWKRDLEEHLNLHINPPVYAYQCRICDYGTSVEYEFKLHRREHRRPRGLQCYLCPFTNRYRINFELHILEHLIECYFCSYETFCKSRFKEHMKCHDLEKKHLYRCSSCTFTTLKELIFEMHLKDHNKSLKMQCRLCSFEVDDILVFDAHVSQHSEMQALCTKRKRRKISDTHTGKYFICKFCNFRYGNAISLRAHLKRCRTVYKSKGAAAKRCKHCQFVTNSKKRLQKHVINVHIFKRITTSKTPFICQNCEFVTRLKSTYNRHAILHSGRVYSCGYCSYKTNVMKILFKHERIHRFKCCICDSTFLTQNQLERHKKKHDAPTLLMDFDAHKQSDDVIVLD